MRPHRGRHQRPNALSAVHPQRQTVVKVILLFATFFLFTFFFQDSWSSAGTVSGQTEEKQSEKEKQRERESESKRWAAAAGLKVTALSGGGRA